MIRALVFDFDGLVIDSETAIAQSWRELYAEHGLDLPEHLWRRMVGTRDHDDLLWDHLAERTGVRLDVPALRDANRKRGLEIANSLETLPGVRIHLDAARDAGLALAVASSSSPSWVLGHLERLGLLHRFAVVCTKEDAARSKPDPGIYLAALARLGVEAANAVAFEDTEPGVTAARAAGMRCVAVPGSFTERMDFSAADLVLRSLADVEPRALWARLDSRSP